MKGVWITKMPKMNDIRMISTDFEVRSDEENKTSIVGYALKFNRESEDLGWFTEIIEEKALDQADLSDVVALINHDRNYVLGRSGNNLELTVDEIGLRFTIYPNNTSYVLDLVENMRTGLVNKCSFAFRVDKDGDKWDKRENGRYLRTISKIKRVYDVSVVTSPAYKDTEAVLSQRSLEVVEKLKQTEVEKRELELMDLEVEFLTES